MSMVEMVQQKAFLGREFLTWLWWRAEEHPVIDLDGRKPVEVEIMETMILEAGYGDARSSALKGESPATSPEAGMALMEGKKVRRMKVKFSSDGMEWLTGIDGETLALLGLNLPKTGRLPYDEAIGLRMESLIEFEGIYSDLFRIFLERRLDERLWRNDLKKIHAWAEAKLPTDLA